MIEGVVVAGRPYIVAVVSVPRLGRSAQIPFLVDTGADVTVIHADDQERLRIAPHRDLTTSSSRLLGGIGGHTTPFVEDCELQFDHVDGTLEVIQIPVYFDLPSDENRTYRSLLGRDVIENFRLIFEQRGRLIVLDEPQFPQEAS